MTREDDRRAVLEAWDRAIHASRAAYGRACEAYLLAVHLAHERPDHAPLERQACDRMLAAYQAWDRAMNPSYYAPDGTPIKTPNNV